MPDPAMLGQIRYPKRAAAAFWTERWVTEALLKRVYLKGAVWEPAAGRGDMARVFQDAGHQVFATDLHDYGCKTMVILPDLNFLRAQIVPEYVANIITNPPYDDGLAEQFVRKALAIEPHVDRVCMLLRNEFDSAASRVDLFDHHFDFKLVLTRRPRWDWWLSEWLHEGKKGCGKVSVGAPGHIKCSHCGVSKEGPRHNYAWFSWTPKRVGRQKLFHG